jgi:hypothetical protein
MNEAEAFSPPRLPDGITTDFKASHPSATLASAGYVTALAAIAYLASGSLWFAGATEEHEHIEEASRDAIFAAGVWSTVQENLLHYFPETDGIVAAEMKLRGLLESGRIDGIARPIGSHSSEPLPPYVFADWNRSFQTHVGLVLVPGYWGMKVNAAMLRTIAPPRAEKSTAKPAPVRERATKTKSLYPVCRRLFELHHDEFSNAGGIEKRHQALKRRWPLAMEKGWTKESCPHKMGVDANWTRYVEERAASANSAEGSPRTPC